MTEREWLARQFEEKLAPKLVDPALAERAVAFFEAHVLEHSPGPIAEAGYRTDCDATLLVHHATRTALENAIRATAAALRDGTLR